MFSPNANRVGAINAMPTFAPAPLALGPNTKPRTHDRAGYNAERRHQKQAFERQVVPKSLRRLLSGKIFFEKTA
jgi:hypothetical protein